MMAKRGMITVTQPDFSRMRAEAVRQERALRRAALEATDIAASKAQKHVQAKIRAVGLKNLSNAVGYTSAKRKRQDPKKPYGVIFARGGDESRAGGALEAYGKGTTIYPVRGSWLAFPTGAIPSKVGRRKMTPELYNKSGLTGSIGPLIFRRIKPNVALLVLRKVSISPKNGRAKMLGKRRPRTRIVPERDVTAFVLIKQTRRAQRFNKDEIMQFYSGRVPLYLERLMKDYY